MLKSVRLSNYRNLNLECNLERANIIIAPNGSGKSNFLEAIYFSNFGRPFRAILSLDELVGTLENFAKVDLEWSSGEMTVTVSRTDKLERRFIVLGKRQKLADIIGKRNIVLFAPTTINLVLGEPAVRRDDLDDYLTMFDTDYALAIEAYQTALKNRNALIKMLADEKPVEQEFRHFTQTLVEHGAIIYAIRKDFFANVMPLINEIGAELFASDLLSLNVEYLPNFVPQISYASELAAKFRQNYQKEIIVGKTLYGVHKDDYMFKLGEADLRFRGSRGQQRLAGLVFKLAQLNLLNQNKEAENLLLLDDLMSELDKQHRESCAAYLLNHDTQFILTSAEELDVPAELISAGNQLIIR